MPTSNEAIADYLAFSDAETTLRANPQGGALGEKLFSKTLPGATQLSAYEKAPILMFMVRTQHGPVTVDIDVNSQFTKRIVGFESSVAQAFHEVIDPQLFNAGSENNIKFRFVGSDPDAEFIFSDVVLWFQRTITTNLI
jgi:hypothetical protein